MYFDRYRFVVLPEEFIVPERPQSTDVQHQLHFKLSLLKVRNQLEENIEKS